jgi:hypothetical protein
MMCLLSSYKKTFEKKIFFASDPLVRGTDPDPHQNVTDPQQSTLVLT